ncbi:MAG: carbamoyltransferase [Planctomycetota bacterium]
MIILGVSAGDQHDPSSALLVDGHIVAAAEEERFNRIKHSVDHNPIASARFCLKQAGIGPEQVDVVAFPWSPDAYRRGRWPHLRRYLDYPSYWPSILKRPRRHIRRKRKLLASLLSELGIDRSKTRTEFVEHHMAHASSCYHLSGFPSAAVLTIDGYGEYASALYAVGEGPDIRKLGEMTLPDSLGLFYSLVTEYLGFRPNNGEFKVMGMSAYGEADKIDLSELVELTADSIELNKHYLWKLFNPARHKRYRPRSRELAELFGPPRTGDGLGEPYTHVAAACQAFLEKALFHLVEKQLGQALRQCDGRLAFAGGTALNVRANGKLITSGKVKQLWVQPAAHDAGLSLGAATFAAVRAGETVAPQEHAYLGPAYSDEQIRAVLEQFRIPYKEVDDVVEFTAGLLAEGKIVSFFQGRMEWGPRALGNRSILANPKVKGISDEINARIKFRETWRPFCPSLSADVARDLLGHDHPSPYMTFSFPVVEDQRDIIGECLHVDGTGRPQTVTEKANPLYHNLLKCFHEKTGVPALLNTSLNRRGEPMVCSPEDAVAMFYGSGLEHMVIGGFYVTK